MNITHHVKRGHLLFPEQLALIFEDKCYTYKQLDQLANQVANGLQAFRDSKR